MAKKINWEYSEPELDFETGEETGNILTHTISLCYSYEHSSFELVVPPSEIAPQGYKLIAPQMDRQDAETFIDRMHRKYVRGRKSGRYPTAQIIRLELELFVKLKNYRRRLV